jgi:hypothetical protein
MKVERRRGERTARPLFALLFGLAAGGCAPAIGGRASFPLMSRATVSGYDQPVATVDEKRCSHIVLFLFAWGEDPNHEALVTDVLAKYKGDAITDAELTFYSIPAVVYTQQCARVTGTVVRRSASGSLHTGVQPIALANTAERSP